MHSVCTLVVCFAGHTRSEATSQRISGMDFGAVGTFSFTRCAGVSPFFLPVERNISCWLNWRIFKIKKFIEIDEVACLLGRVGNDGSGNDEQQKTNW